MQKAGKINNYSLKILAQAIFAKEPTKVFTPEECTI